MTKQKYALNPYNCTHYKLKSILQNEIERKKMDKFVTKHEFSFSWMIWFVSVYLSSLPVENLSDVPRRRLVVTGYCELIQDETTESSARFFIVLAL